jgi:hypothetical protein
MHLGFLGIAERMEHLLQVDILDIVVIPFLGLVVMLRVVFLDGVEKAGKADFQALVPQVGFRE